jgi:hypothetical protein
MNKRFLLMMDHLPLVNIGKDTSSKERRNPVCIKGQKGFKLLSSVTHLTSRWARGLNDQYVLRPFRGSPWWREPL